MRSAGRRVFRGAAKKSPWWQKFFAEHPFRTLSLAVLCIGGLQLLIYFLHIGQLPDANLASSTSILTAVALLGISIFLVFGGSAVVAGFMYLNAGRENAWLRSQDSLVLAAIPGVTINIGLVVQSLIGVELIDAATIQPLAVGLCVLLGDLRALQLVRVGELPAVTDGLRRGMPRVRDICTFAFYSYAWALFMAIGTMVFIAMIPFGASLAQTVPALMSWLVISTAINLDFARSTPVADQAKKLILMTLIGAMLMITLTQNYSGVAIASIRKLGIGAVPVKLVLTKRGCQIANASSSVGPICVADDVNKLGVVCPAILLSKIGTPFLFGVTAFTTSGGWPTPELPKAIPLPPSEVLSWPRISPLESQSQRDIASSSSSKNELRPVSMTDVSRLDVREKDWLREQCGWDVSGPSQGASLSRPASAP